MAITRVCFLLLLVVATQLCTAARVKRQQLKANTLKATDTSTKSGSFSADQKTEEAPEQTSGKSLAPTENDGFDADMLPQKTEGEVNPNCDVGQPCWRGSHTNSNSNDDDDDESSSNSSNSDSNSISNSNSNDEKSTSTGTTTTTSLSKTATSKKLLNKTKVFGKDLIKDAKNGDVVAISLLVLSGVLVISLVALLMYCLCKGLCKCCGGNDESNQHHRHCHDRKRKDVTDMPGYGQYGYEVFVCPEGVHPGMTVEVFPASMNGSSMWVEVPDDIRPGEEFLVKVSDSTDK